MSDDWSPALGGDRASEPPPDPPPDDAGGTPPPPPGGQTSGDPAFDLASGLAALFGGELNVEVNGDPNAIIGALEGFMSTAASIIEQRLPTTLAAFEGLVDAVESALEPLFAEDTPPPPPPGQDP